MSSTSSIVMDVEAKDTPEGPSYNLQVAVQTEKVKAIKGLFNLVRRGKWNEGTKFELRLKNSGGAEALAVGDKLLGMALRYQTSPEQSGTDVLDLSHGKVISQSEMSLGVISFVYRDDELTYVNCDTGAYVLSLKEMN